MMKIFLPENGRPQRKRDRGAYTCVDEVRIDYDRNAAKMNERDRRVVLRNGIKLMFCQPPVAVVAGTQTSRCMAEIINGGSNKTYSFPQTVTAICSNDQMEISDYREYFDFLYHGFLGGMERLSFCCSEIRRLVLSPNISSIGAFAFYNCQ